MLTGGLGTGILSGVGPVVLGAGVVAAFLLFTWYAGPDPSGRRAYGAYLLTAVFVGIFVGLWAIFGLAGAAAEAITDRAAGVNCAGGDVIRPAQETPPPPPTPPAFDFPTPIPFELGFDCEPGSGRERASADALRSGTLFLVAGAFVGAHARGVRRLLEKEEHDA